MTELKLSQWEDRWAFRRGATKATHRAKNRSMTELKDALDQVDGLLAGVTYFENLDPASEETRSSADRKNANICLPQDSLKDSWFGHLTADLPQPNISEPAEQPAIETGRLQNILNDKLVSSHDNSLHLPRKSQWATLRSLREASEYHYLQFTTATTNSTSREVRKLRKSYVTPKDLLEMGILTFRNVLYGRTPTTLVDIFAFASLSYVISKTLHEKGHIDESEILSGILDWRAAIVDEKETAAFDEIAKQLWPEAKEIMHFFHIEKKQLTLEATDLLHDENQASCNSSSMPQDASAAWSFRSVEGHVTFQEGPFFDSWNNEYGSIPQMTGFHTSHFSDLPNPPGRLEDQVYQICQQTKSQEDFDFSSWLNMDGSIQDDISDPSSYQSSATCIDPNVLNPSQTEFPTETESPPSKESSPPLSTPDESFAANPNAKTSEDPVLDRLVNNPLFQVVYRFITDTSDFGDLLAVLSGKGLTTGKGGTRSSSHLSPPLAALEFLCQAPKHLFGPLHREAAQIDESFSGIVAMAEMFVRVGSLHTVREVENYIIAVGRCLIHPYNLFTQLVSKTLIQCLVASQKIKKWNLIYPNSIQEKDEYSIEYISVRQRSEKNWATSEHTKPNPPQGMSYPNTPINEKPAIDPTKSPKHSYQDKSNPTTIRHPSGAIPQHTSSTEGSDGSTTVRCAVDGCSKTYWGNSARTSLARHVRIAHRNRSKLRCPKCPQGRGYTRRDNLRIHFSRSHAGYEPPEWLANKRRGFTNSSPISL